MTKEFTHICKKVGIIFPPYLFYSYLKFYNICSEIVDSVSPQLQSLAGKASINLICLFVPEPKINALGIVETASPQLQTDTMRILSSLSFSHIVKLL